MAVVVVAEQLERQQRVQARPSDQNQVVPVELPAEREQGAHRQLQDDQDEGRREHPRPTGVPCGSDRRQAVPRRGDQSHLLRRKVTNRPTVIATIAPMTTKYPCSQCSSGMLSKFIP